MRVPILILVLLLSGCASPKGDHLTSSPDGWFNVGGSDLGIMYCRGNVDGPVANPVCVSPHFVDNPNPVLHKPAVKTFK